MLGADFSFGCYLGACVYAHMCMLSIHRKKYVLLWVTAKIIAKPLIQKELGLEEGRKGEEPTFGGHRDWGGANSLQ